MKIVSRLLLIISVVALIHGSAYADTSTQTRPQATSGTAVNIYGDHAPDAGHVARADGGKNQKDESTSTGHQDNRRVPASIHPRGAAVGMKNDPKKTLSNTQRFRVSVSVTLHQPTSNSFASAPQAGSIGRETVGVAAPYRTPAVVRPLSSAAARSPHRGAYAVAIDGSANAHVKNSAAINGTRMARRP